MVRNQSITLTSDRSVTCWLISYLGLRTFGFNGNQRITLSRQFRKAGHRLRSGHRFGVITNITRTRLLSRRGVFSYQLRCDSHTPKWGLTWLWKPQEPRPPHSRRPRARPSVSSGFCDRCSTIRACATGYCGIRFLVRRRAPSGPY